MSAATLPESLRHPLAHNRWVHLVAAVVALQAIANVMFAASVQARLPGGTVEAAAALQRALAAFLFAQTLLIPLERWLVDRVGPVVPAAAGVALSVVAWVGASGAEGSGALLAWVALGGAGAGVFFAGSVARALERFGDHRGLSLGVAACAGAAGVLTAWPIARALGVAYAPAFLPWDLAEACLLLVAALFVLDPPPPTWEPPG